MTPSAPDADFVRHLTGCQHWLRAFIRALVPSAEQTDEVLQRTNLVMWKKAHEFTKGTNFRGWACQVARYEVMAFRKEQYRDRHVFSDQLSYLLADEAERHFGVVTDLRDFLRGCLTELSPKHRQLVAERYAPDGSVQSLAEREGRSPDAISAMLYRIRNSLLKCVRRKMALRQGGLHG